MRPKEERIRQLRAASGKIWRQPPIRIRYCHPPLAPKEGCNDQEPCPEAATPCSECQVPYCHRHHPLHIEGLSLPPDAWRGLWRHWTQRDEAAATLTVRWCRVPDTKNMEAACAHRAATCTSESKECPYCYWPYCEHHFASHQRRRRVVPTAWHRVVLQAQRQLASFKKLRPGMRLRFLEA